MRRVATAILALAILATGMGLAFWQESLLWRRVAADAFERYAPDNLLSELPSKLRREDFELLCPHKPRRLANCVGDFPSSPPAEAEISNAAENFSNILDQQFLAADKIATLPDDLPEIERYRNLGQSLRDLQPEFIVNFLETRFPASLERNPGTIGLSAMAHWKKRIRLVAERTAREREAIRPALEQAESLSARWNAVRNLGLLAAGLRLQRDFGALPPAPILVADRGLLGEQIEWMRRADRNGAQDAVSKSSRNALFGIANAGLVAVIVAIAIDSAPALVAIVPVLLAASWLMLMDLATGGPGALRYLAVLQFKPAWISVGTLSAPIHLPLLVFALALVLIKCSWQSPLKWFWYLPERWVATGNPLITVGGGLFLLATSTALVAVAGYSAGISEILIGLGCVAIATYMARQAAFRNIGGGVGHYTLPVLVLGVIAAVGASLTRGDLGHALVAVALFLGFIFLFLKPAGLLFWSASWLLGMLGMARIVGLEASTEFPEQHVYRLAEWVEQYKPHVAERLRLFVDAFNHGPSDLARLRWLQASAGNDGWGIGHTPWTGLPGARMSDGLPMQAPSDYIFTVAQAIWGWPIAWLLVAGAVALFLFGAWRGLRLALGDGYGYSRRFAGGIGALGCLAILIKAVLSVFGTIGTLPLTGVPVALLSYGPTAEWAALAYLAMVLGTPAQTEDCT